MRTRRPENRTPSACSRRRWSRPLAPGRAMRPPAANTLCQGRPKLAGAWRKAQPTRRGVQGRPTAVAMSPYVTTFPRGMLRTTRQARATSWSCVGVFTLRACIRGALEGHDPADILCCEWLTQHRLSLGGHDFPAIHGRSGILHEDEVPGLAVNPLVDLQSTKAPDASRAEHPLEPHSFAQVHRLLGC